MDGHDASIGQFGTVEATRGQKVTCAECHTIWRGFRDLTLREANFKTSVSRWGRCCRFCLMHSLKIRFKPTQPIGTFIGQSTR